MQVMATPLNTYWIMYWRWSKMMQIPFDLKKVIKEYEKEADKADELKVEVDNIAIKYGFSNFTYSNKNLRKLKDLAKNGELLAIIELNRAKSATSKLKGLRDYMIEHYKEGCDSSFEYTTKSNGCITLRGVQLPSLKPEFVKNIMRSDIRYYEPFELEILFECYFFNIGEKIGKLYNFDSLTKYNKYVFQIENRIYTLRSRPTKDASLDRYIALLTKDEFEFEDWGVDPISKRLENANNKEIEANKDIEGLTKIYSSIIQTIPANL